MAGQHGVKELSEAIVGVMALVKEIKLLTADGAQIADLAALYAKYQSDAAFKAKLDVAFADISNAKVEIAEFDLMDGVELLKVLLNEISAAK